MATDVVLRFDEVSFEYGHNKPILDEVSFSVRRGSKITIMGQNGAGKSTIFGMILAAAGQNAGQGQTTPKITSGNIHITRGLSIAIARQVIPRPELALSVRDFFQKALMDTNGGKKCTISTRAWTKRSMR
ncbi:MAG TPA: ATP-binding cassette domain-containing protein [Candidatus Paceibacterota bacterium]|nr:ATP-binding cassette domain-containing protein [Candidatus Paceibacterota bacterium]